MGSIAYIEQILGGWFTSMLGSTFLIRFVLVLLILALMFMFALPLESTLAIGALCIALLFSYGILPLWVQYLMYVVLGGVVVGFGITKIIGNR